MFCRFAKNSRNLYKNFFLLLLFRKCKSRCDRIIYRLYTNHFINGTQRLLASYIAYINKNYLQTNGDIIDKYFPSGKFDRVQQFFPPQFYCLAEILRLCFFLFNKFSISINKLRAIPWKIKCKQWSQRVKLSNFSLTRFSLTKINIFSV